MQTDVDRLIARLNAELGREVAYRASDSAADPRVPTGLPSLDVSIGGGLPRGIPVMLQGQPSTGKSSLAYKLCGQATAVTGLPAAVVYSEGPFEIHREWALKCGLPEHTVVIETGCLEEAINAVFELAASGAVSSILVDSLSTLKTKAILAAKPGEHKSFGGRAVMLNEFFNKIVNKCARPFPVLLFTSHLYQNPLPTGGFVWRPSGGMDQEYMSGLILRLARADVGERKLKLAGGEASEVNYIDVSWRVEKTKVGGRYHDCGGYRLYLADDIFAAGTISDHEQAAKMGIMVGLIKKAGAWYTYKGKKYQGVDALLPYIDREECVNAYQEELGRQRIRLRNALAEEAAEDVPGDEGEEGGPKRGRGRQG